MPPTEHRIAYVVPTKDRPVDLRLMLESLTRQTRLPDQVIIVDGSGESIEHVVRDFNQFPIVYVRCVPPGLAKQRNAGMARLGDDITHAGYLDDDLVLEPKATEEMMRFWKEAGDEVGGAAFSIINQPAASGRKFAAFFMISNMVPGSIMPSGFPSPIPYLQQNTRTEWLYGGATVWSREVIREFSFDEWYIGTGFLEDVDYSFRVSHKKKLYVVGAAQVNHYSRPVPLNRQFAVGRQQIANRIYFFKKMKAFSLAALCWAFLGQFIHNVGSSIKNRDSAGFRRAIGNIDAAFKNFFDQSQRKPDFFK